MKTIILITLTVLTSVVAFPQTRAQRELSARAETYLTEFNDMNVNFVNARVQDFLFDELDLVPTEDPEYSFVDEIVTITETYRKSVRTATNDHSLQVIYKAKPEGNDLIIQTCQVSGFDVYVVDFFVKYWNTTLNFESVKKGEVVVNYWITDRASLSLLGNRTAKIDIVKN